MNTIVRFSAWLACLALTPLCHTCIAQQCSREALTAKYWQYREDFNRHFIMNDRKPEGCIGNGLTRSEDDLSQLNCNTALLHGYGLPATSIIMEPTGGFGMGERNQQYIDNDPTKGLNQFYDQDCAIDETNYGSIPSDNLSVGEAHNVLEYSSETPHQIGWYLVTLATEYALLGQNGQLEEQQRTLEDLFLALQAYRRLDITANCLVKERYNEIRDFKEVSLGFPPPKSCLCLDKYANKQCEGWLPWKWNFNIQCNGATCPWQPNLTGYSGFFIREDATQEQEALHDPSDDKWNIDLVAGGFAMSENPPCSTTFSKPCYMERNTGYLSQDQLFSVMIGLAAVKNYIPPSATVVTCDGQVFNPYDIVQEISNGFVKLPQNSTRHIFWPGSSDEDCCDQAIKFSECAGGNFQATYAGVEYMHNYINDGDDDHKIGLFDRTKWGPSVRREVWYATAMGISLDIGDMPHPHKFIDAAFVSDKPIFFLMNDLLHPEEPNLVGPGDDLAAFKLIFEEMLCRAPCGGVCIKPFGWDEAKEGDENSIPQKKWPDFECANTPEWTGQRWEGSGGGPKWEELYLARQFNGLDFMALYNLYMLRYPDAQTAYYNPERPEVTPYGRFLGENKIEGPTTLCPGESGSYLLNSTYPAPSAPHSLVWESSSNISLSSTSSNPTTATLMTVQTPSSIEVSFKETRGIPERKVVEVPVGWSTIRMNLPTDNDLDDVCGFTYYKPIITEVPDYTIVTEMDFCEGIYRAIAEGPEYVRATTWNWTITDSNTGQTITGDGLFLDFESILPTTPGWYGYVTINLVVQNACGTFNQTLNVGYQICPTGPPGGGTQWLQIIITPNPTSNQASVRITQNQTQDFISTDPNGVRIRFYPANGGTSALMSTYLNYNGQNFNVSSLPVGVYYVVATASDMSTIQSNLSIVR